MAPNSPQIKPDPDAPEMMDDVILSQIEPAPDTPKITDNDNSLQKQIEALQQQMEASNKVHLAELAKIQNHAAACEEELQSLRHLSSLQRPTKNNVRENVTEVQDSDNMDQDVDIPYWPYDKQDATSIVSFAQYCNYFATGPYLSQKDWDLIIPYMSEQRPLNLGEHEAPVNDEFWEVCDTWGGGRKSFPFVESDGVLQSTLGLYAVLKYRSHHFHLDPDCDWRNMVLLSVRQLMRDMLSKRMAYTGLVCLIGDTLAELVNAKSVQKDDPLRFAIWQLAACADELVTRFSSAKHSSLGASLSEGWSVISLAILQHMDYKHLCPFELVLQATVNTVAPGTPYFHTSKTGVIARKDTQTNQRQYILLDFASKKLRLVEEDRLVYPKGDCPMMPIKVEGNDEDTCYNFVVDKPSWEHFMRSLESLDG